MKYMPPVRSAANMDLYRVVVEEIEDKTDPSNVKTNYVIHTGDKMVRILTESELPIIVAAKITLIKAYATGTGQVANLGTPYTSRFPEEFNDIGWLIEGGNKTDRIYCVIMPTNVLYYLRGDNGSNTRVKS